MKLQCGLTEQSQGFDYTNLDAETQIIIQQHTSEIKNLVHRTAQDTIAIGQKLIEVKERLGHGKFMNWLKSEFNWSISTATRFMQVSEHFKFVNLMNLNIAPSALYLLAAPSTPSQARTELLKRATQGEAITCALARAIVDQHKKVAKPESAPSVTVDSSVDTVRCELSTPAVAGVTQTVKAESAFVLQQSEDKLPEKETEAPEQFQISNRFHGMTSTANRSDCLPQDQAPMQIQSRFQIGRLIHIMEFHEQNCRWLGEITELRDAAATGVEVVIKISTQLHSNRSSVAKDKKSTYNNTSSS